MSLRDFPGGSVVETLVCHCRGVRDGSPVWEVRFHMWTGRAENKREGRENMGPPGVLESLTSASPVFKKKKSLRLAVSFPPHLFPSLRLILLLCIGSASSNHQSSKYSPLMVPHPGLKKRQPQAPGAGDGGDRDVLPSHSAHWVLTPSERNPSLQLPEGSRCMQLPPHYLRWSFLPSSCLHPTYHP